MTNHRCETLWAAWGSDKTLQKYGLQGIRSYRKSGTFKQDAAWLLRAGSQSVIEAYLHRGKAELRQPRPLSTHCPKQNQTSLPRHPFQMQSSWHVTIALSWPTIHSLYPLPASLPPFPLLASLSCKCPFPPTSALWLHTQIPKKIYTQRKGHVWGPWVKGKQKNLCTPFETFPNDCIISK